MPKTSPLDLFVPLPELADFVSVLRTILSALFEAAHDHLPRTTAPGESDGAVGDIVPVTTENTTRLYTKLSTGWERTSNLVPADKELWDDFRFPAQAINPPGIASDPTWDTTNIGWSFANGATKVIQMVAQMPHGWVEGSRIHPHIHWEPSTAATGNVLWRLQYRWRDEGDTAEALTTLDILAPANGTALTLQRDFFPYVSGAGKEKSSILELQLSRIGGDTTDTFSGAAILKEFDIHYQLDSLGSSVES